LDWEPKSGYSSGSGRASRSIGCTIATGSNDTSLRLVRWTDADSDSGNGLGGSGALATIPSMGGTVRGVAFLAPGLVATAGTGDFAIRVWDVATMKADPVAILRGHADVVYGLQRMENNILVTASGDGQSLLFDTRVPTGCTCTSLFSAGGNRTSWSGGSALNSAAPTSASRELHAVAANERSYKVAVAADDGSICVLDPRMAGA